MNMMSRDERKNIKGIKKFLNSFTYPIKGLKYAYRNEQNLAFDCFIAIFVIVMGIIFKISVVEWAFLIFTVYNYFRFSLCTFFYLFHYSGIIIP